MLTRFFNLMLLFALAVNANAQVNDAQNLTKDVKALMYSDPEKAIKTAQYIISNQSFGTSEDVYNALLLQSEIFFNQRRYNDAAVKLISADRISTSVDNDFLKAKNDYLIGRIYLELGFSDELQQIINNMDDISQSLKDDEKTCVRNWVNELEILQFYHQKKYKETLSLIAMSISNASDLDKTYKDRLLLIKASTDNQMIPGLQNADSYFQLLGQVLVLQSKAAKGEVSQSDIAAVKNKFPNYNSGVFFTDVYYANISFYTGANNYCAAGSTYLLSEKIANVTFADINNNSSSTAGYEDFSNVIGNVSAGQIYNFTASSTTGSADFDQVIVWIDLNQDGDFTDAGEKVLTTAYGKAPWKGVITIPSAILAGRTKMRVRLYGAIQNPNETPCGNSYYGQVEDYSLNVGQLAVSDAEKVSVKYYPNPVKDLLTIKSETKVKYIEVFSNTGQLLKTNKDSNVIDLAELPTGTYIIKTIFDKYIDVTKIIKK